MTVIVIPTYNERENCERLLAEIFFAVPGTHVIMVDDTSTDGTTGVIQNLQKRYPDLTLITRSKARNFAHSYRDGFAHALRKGADVIVQMDADLSHTPADIPRLIAALESADCAIGSRYCPGGSTEGWPFYRKAISRLGNFFVAKKTGLPLRDATAGFVAWRAPMLAQILQEPSAVNGYAFQVELKYRAWKHGARITEAPIVFRERERGASKMSWHTVVEAVRFVRSLSH